MIVAIGSPWVGGKAMAIAVAGDSARRRRRAPRRCSSERVVTVVGGADRWGVVLIAIAGGVLWSNALAYRDVNLAPRDQLAELETIGHRIAGQGPTLMTEYEPYGVRHFLRDADPEGASELRRRRVPLLSGAGALHKGMTADTDAFQLDGLLVYRTLVLRRSPFQSRPPSPYRLIWRGDYYEVWQRPRGPQRLGHRPPRPRQRGGPRGGAALPAPSAGSRVRPAPGRARRGRAEPVETIVPLQATGPSTRPGNGRASRGACCPTTPGRSSARCESRAPGDYDVWLGGSVRPEVDLTVDGRPVGEVAAPAQQRRASTCCSAGARLAPGEHTLTIRFHGADLHPGSGGAPSPVGPLVLSSQDAADTRVSHFEARDARRACAGSAGTGSRRSASPARARRSAQAPRPDVDAPTGRAQSSSIGCGAPTW